MHNPAPGQRALSPVVLVATALLLAAAAMAALYNRELFQLINSAHNDGLDALFGLVSGLGDGLVAALLVALLLLFNPRAALAASLALILSGAAAQLLKHLVDAPRPAAVFDSVHLLGDALHAHSFPSGHSATDGSMLLLALLLFGWRSLPGLLGAALFLLAIYGRIYGGAHFPLDAVVGAALGVAAMWWSWIWVGNLSRQEWLEGESMQRGAVPIVALLAAVLAFGYRIQPVTAQPLAWLLPLSALAVILWRNRRSRGDEGSL